MKPRPLIIVFVILLQPLNAQVYQGLYKDAANTFSCALQINPDSSAILVYNDEANELYVEYLGNIKRTGTERYHLHLNMSIGKIDVMSQHTVDRETGVLHDTDFLWINSTFEPVFKKVRIKYGNGLGQDYGFKTGKPLALNRKHFNKALTSNYYTIHTDTVDKISRQPLSFKVRYGSAPAFESGRPLNFNVSIKEGKVEALLTPGSQDLPFTLSLRRSKEK